MASIICRNDHPAESRWQATIRRKGFPTQCKAFPTKGDAAAWAQAVETEMRRGLFLDGTKARETTLGDLLARYAKEVSPGKKGHQVEAYVLGAMQRWTLCKYAVANISTAVLSQWRDDRLTEVSGSTVNRELNLLSHVFRTAMTEWGILLPFNPVSRIRRPRHNMPRNRRTEGDEETRLFDACKASPDKFLFPIVVLAIETGMRRGEVLGLLWSNVDLTQRTAFLPDTKNGHGRTVALSSRAAEILVSIDTDKAGRVFPGVTTHSISGQYRRARAKTGIRDLRLHDLRHEATSRFFEKGLGVMEVASITGHKALSMLQRYTHLRAAELAKKLG